MEIDRVNLNNTPFIFEDSELKGNLDNLQQNVNLVTKNYNNFKDNIGKSYGVAKLDSNGKLSESNMPLQLSDKGEKNSNAIFTSKGAYNYFNHYANKDDWIGSVFYRYLGRKWSEISSPFTTNIIDTAYDGTTRLLSVARVQNSISSKNLYKSTDDIHWTAVNWPGADSTILEHVDYIDGKWFLYGSMGLYKSTDLITWTNISPESGRIKDLKKLDYGYLCITESGLYTSPITLSKWEKQITNNLSKICIMGNNNALIVGSSCYIMTKTAVSQGWNRINLSYTDFIDGAAISSDSYILLRPSGAYYTSSLSSTPSKVCSGTNFVKCYGFNNGHAIVLGGSNDPGVWISVRGNDWGKYTSNQYTHVIYDNNAYIIYNNNSTNMRYLLSNDFNNWFTYSLPNSSQTALMYYGRGAWRMISSNSKQYYSNFNNSDFYI